MRPKLIIMWLVGILTLASCQQDIMSEPPIVGTRADEETADNQFAISPEEALANLSNYIKLAEIKQNTRAVSDNSNISDSSKFEIESIIPIKYSNTTTRTITASAKCDNLLFLANFTKNNGYAILSGDKRIEEPVLAFISEGNLSPEILKNATNRAETIRPTFNGYPKIGSEWFTDDAGNLRLNPNTASLYIDSVGESLVGNLLINPKQGKYELSYDLGSFTPESLTSVLCAEYAYKCVNRHDSELHSFQSSWEPLDHGNGISIVKQIDTVWNVDNQVSPLLTRYKLWHQHSPFNNNYHDAIFSGNKAPAGCFPLAIAKILAYFRHPRTYYDGDYKIDWNLLQMEISPFNGYKFKNEASNICAAHLLRKIRSKCHSICFPEGTFTFPREATKLMRELGFYDSHNHDYAFENIKIMLDKGYPTIISGFPGISIHLSHAWNIDGYRSGNRIITITYNDGNQSTGTRYFDMIHCDFGWKGRCNGYYVSKIFKLNGEDTEIDPGSESGGDTRYNNFLRIVVYRDIIDM